MPWRATQIRVQNAPVHAQAACSRPSNRCTTRTTAPLPLLLLARLERGRESQTTLTQPHFTSTRLTTTCFVLRWHSVSSPSCGSLCYCTPRGYVLGPQSRTPESCARGAVGDVGINVSWVSCIPFGVNTEPPACLSHNNPRVQHVNWHRWVNVLVREEVP